MHVKKTTTVEVRFYGGGELETGVKYEAADTGGLEVDKSLIPKMPKGSLTLTVQRARLKEGAEGKPGAPVLEMELDAEDIKYTKDAPYVLRVEFPDNAEMRDEVAKARKLYNADIDTVILVSLSQGTGESYNRVSFWEKEKPAEETEAAEAKPSSGRKAGKKKSSKVITVTD